MKCVEVLSFALNAPLQAESRTAELSSLLNKVQSEDAALKDSLAKLGSMNEGLAQDKVDLNTYIHQVCVKVATVSSPVTVGGRNSSQTTQKSNRNTSPCFHCLLNFSLNNFIFF